MTSTPGLLMLENHEDLCQRWPEVTFLAYIWVAYQESEAERTNHVESLTVSKVQSSSWLFATDLTCEEEQRSFFFTIKVHHLPWVSHREKGSQASTPLSGKNPFDADYGEVQAYKRHYIPSYHTDKIVMLLTIFIELKQ